MTNEIRTKIEEFLGNSLAEVVKDGLADYIIEDANVEYIVTDKTGGIHRGPWDKETAETWVAECDNVGFKPGTFWVQEIITFGVPPQVEEPYLVL